MTVHILCDDPKCWICGISTEEIAWEDGEVAPAPEHDTHLLHWIACPDGSPPMIWTWLAADRSWHWYDPDIEEDDGYEGLECGPTAGQRAYRGGFRYLCPAVPPSAPEAATSDRFLEATRDLSDGSF